ncbi:hypothetical protein JWG42_18690, partial [Desulfoprunum benzoelyticum]|uniref:hypothetical protein n=1 Tax=Desulfoprunum benzoelyticum TaxID=1506996 RepID=UPI0019646195
CFLPWHAPLVVVLREYLTMVGRTDRVPSRINLSRLSFSGNQISFSSGISPTDVFKGYAMA